MILIDDREKVIKPDSTIFKVERLAIGDYYINNKIIIERKTYVDLITSINNGHLENQLGCLKNIKKQKFLLIEDVSNKRRKKIIKQKKYSQSELIDLMNTLSLKYDINVIYTYTWQKTVDFLIQCYNNTVTDNDSDNDDSDKIFSTKRCLKLKKDVIINSISLIDGISFKKASFIYKNFGGDNFWSKTHNGGDDFFESISNTMFNNRKIGKVAFKIKHYFI